ncbi:MAG: phenylalanine--tRNA ligase subunit alpha [Legionellaceae bacterium]|nr:phenylalanine--tRNA ligase subunit alpha [Legionellaceae bacterium]
MLDDIKRLESEALKAIEKAERLDVLEAIRVDFLGKKGKLTDILKGVSSLSPAEKPKVGQAVNQVKRKILASLEEKHEHLKILELQIKLAHEKIDVTLPGRQANKGTLHPITQVRDKIIDYFSRLGFDVLDGPEVETEHHNFEALNIPDHHPARAMHDTFYFGDGRLLRTHTSPVQIRSMQSGGKPPFRLIAPGRVYRRDSDVTHTPMFHQLEGLLIDEVSQNITLASLKGVLQDFFTFFFEKSVGVRFRPSYFPFTEPSAEVDIACTACDGKGCRVCSFTGWLEVLGCGMVHPNVLNAVNLSPEMYQGWAFGLGIDRLAMLYFGIDDLRMMFEHDLNFLKQF